MGKGEGNEGPGGGRGLGREERGGEAGYCVPDTDS